MKNYWIYFYSEIFITPNLIFTLYHNSIDYLKSVFSVTAVEYFCIYSNACLVLCLAFFVVRNVIIDMCMNCANFRQVISQRTKKGTCMSIFSEMFLEM